MSPIARSILLASACAASLPAAACQAQSAQNRVPVLELYTSEGCSSCPPADRWLSGLKTAAAEGRVVAQAFHVGYWDYIGWVDRFASPAHTARQREVAARNGARGVYTPQLVRDGRDWTDFGRAMEGAPEPAGASIRLARATPDTVEADVKPATAGASWAAYWTVTEHGHSSKVRAGENSGELLKHDFVVRQYVPAGQYQGTQRLTVHTVAASAGHPMQVNLVVFEPRSGKTLQALSLQCGT
ncbi:DUF1223 domain-containing protein [Ramlibacter solisilvae]|uniref:DUF1223 domain-containing protein n=1 Tax=Ramlibacter tataouinensis TaxID=94132 RepID=UPI0009EE7372|nr:DUF1223 domain-containing protein [Ramlibacter tataouinensis]